MKFTSVLIALSTALISACEISAPTELHVDPAPPEFSGREAADRWLRENINIAGTDFCLKMFVLDFQIPLRPINWYMTEDAKWERELGPIASLDHIRQLPAADVAFSFEPDETAMSPFQLDALNFLRDFNAGRI